MANQLPSPLENAKRTLSPASSRTLSPDYLPAPSKSPVRTNPPRHKSLRNYRLTERPLHRTTTEPSTATACARTGKERCYCQPRRKAIRTYPSAQGRIRTTSAEGRMEWPPHIAGTAGYAQSLVQLSNANGTGSWATSPAGVAARQALGQALADMEMGFLEEKIREMTAELRRDLERLDVLKGKWRRVESKEGSNERKVPEHREKSKEGKRAVIKRHVKRWRK